MTTIVQRQTAKPTPKPTPKPTANALAAGPLATVPSILRRLVARVAAGLSRQAINRRVVRKLALLSDRELKDIGLVRQDVEDAGSAIGDASLLLLARRDERRRGRAS